MSPMAARTAGATPVAAPEKNLTTDIDALLAAVTMRTKIVFLANPSNPTGPYTSAEDVARLHAGLPPSVLLIIDAAYAEFVSRNDYEPGAGVVDAAFAKGAANVVMLRTFSKIYALGGMRLGWAYCPPSVADVLNRVRAPFNVNAAAQAAGIAALADVAAVDRAREHNDIRLPWFSRELAALGLPVNPTVGNFVLVRFPAAPAQNADAAFAHLQSCGILTRKMGGYHLPESLRRCGRAPSSPMSARSSRRSSVISSRACRRASTSSPAIRSPVPSIPGQNRVSPSSSATAGAS